MGFLSNPGFLAVAFIEASAAFMLLVVYWLLAPGFRARFFRLWMAGWTVYVAMGALRIFSLSRSEPEPALAPALSLLAAAFFLMAVLDCTGYAQRLRLLWPLSVLPGSAVAALEYVARWPLAARWAESIIGGVMFLCAGWFLWRSHPHHRGFGGKLLAGALMLRGLHGLDHPDWSATSLGLFRVSFQGVFGVAIGIAMAVLVLEAGRSRTEDLNEKLRRLAVIAAEASRSSRVQEALNGVLRHLVESLAASHGCVFLLDGPGENSSLVLHATVGFDDRFRRERARVSRRESWVVRVLHHDAPLTAFSGAGDPEVRRWMQAEKLEAVALVRIPGKKTPLGLLAIGFSAPRSFQTDEEHFLVNIAHLLGLSAQNVALFETAATARRQWLDTFDSIADLILVHSLEGRLLRANRALAERLGARPESLAGRRLREILPHRSDQWTRCPYCEGEAARPLEFDATFGGYFLATSSTLHDSAGNRLGTIHVLKDITERREAENKFRTLFERVQEGIFISTPGGRFLDFNDAFLRILGYANREELLRVDIASTLYVNAADRERLKRLLREYGEVTDFEFEFRRRDGEVRTGRESSFVTRDPAGDVVAYQGFLVDVTDQKRAEMEIRRRNRELLALNAIAEMLGQLESLEQVLPRVLFRITELFSVDLGAIYLIDEGSRQLKRVAAVGHRSDYAGSFPVLELSAHVLQQIRQTRATLLPGSSLALPDLFRDMQRREGVELSQIVILWAKDRIMGALVIGSRVMREFSTAELNLLAALGNQVATAIDKSLLLQETREAYDTLRRTQEQLLQSEKMAATGRLISGVAHELNNPLTAILGYTQLLKSEDLGGERAQDFLEKLNKQAQRTHHIVQNLLSFARQHKPERATVQLNHILEDTLLLREHELRANNIRIHRELDPHLPTTSGDFHQLQQVFLNILNNAVDAVLEKDKEGDIWVRTEAEGDRLRVEFTDSGPGVQNPHRVFDPFYTTKPAGKGTGLGLSICYGIVKEHGGEIQVRNSPARGGTFSITLPLIPVTPALPSEQPPHTSTAPAGRILLVDDEESILHCEQEFLRGRGITLRVARSAQEAITLLERESFDAVVSDTKMPGKVPLSDFLEWIASRCPELKTRVILTASDAGDTGLNELLRRSGCPVIRKPFQPEALWEAIQKVLRTAEAAPLEC